MNKARLNLAQNVRHAQGDLNVSELRVLLRRRRSIGREQRTMIFLLSLGVSIGAAGRLRGSSGYFFLANLRSCRFKPSAQSVSQFGTVSICSRNRRKQMTNS